MYRVAKTVRATHGLDGAVVLDIRQGQMFNLKPVGSRILELVKEGSNQEHITDEISREFSVARKVAERDVREFLQDLQNNHLVEECEPGPAV